VNTGASSSSASQSSSAGSQNKVDTINYALWSNPSGRFNPQTYQTDYDRAVVFTVFSRLVVLDAKQGYQPSLAKDFVWADNYKTLTFDLRKGVKWHDGQPFTAQDVKFTYSATADGDFPNGTPEFAKHLKGFSDYSQHKTNDLAGITTAGDYKVSFHFDTPYSGALTYFTDKPVLAKHIWQNTPVKDWNSATQLLRNPVGTGPYKFVKFVDGQYVQLEANKDYFGGVPKTKNFIFKVINQDTVQTAVTNGEVDIAEISDWNPSQVSAYKDSGINVVEQTAVSGQYLSLDTNNPKLKDERVRQALVYAIDRKGIVQSLLYGHGKVINADVQADDPALPKDLNKYAYSKSEAKKLLAQAGWKDTDGDDILDKDGQKFTFTISFPTGNKVRELSAPIIQQNLKDIGIDATLSSADFNTTLAILQDSTRRYDGVLMGGTFRPRQFGGSNWWARWGTEGKAKSALDKVSSAVADNAYFSAAADYLNIENVQVPFVWLYSPSTGFAVRKQVQNFKPYAYETFANVNEWYVTR
jgi:peptide/nickel transport system substrate-binding protein